VTEMQNRLGFKLILSAINEDLYEAFKREFEDFPDVEVVFGRFEYTDFDCVVSAANSFGLMDGGVDQCITDYFGLQMMKRVQQMIVNEFAGEQPVGTSVIVPGIKFDMIGTEVRFDRMKYVAHTPTMRVPRDVNRTDHPYKAMKAALLAVRNHNRSIEARNLNGDEVKAWEKEIRSLVCPGLGTNAGRVPADRAARQMALALFHVLNPPVMIDWYFAGQRDGEIMESRNYEKVTE